MKSDSNYSSSTISESSEDNKLLTSGDIISSLEENIYFDG